MPGIFHVDHKIVAASVLAATTGVALYSSWKVWSLKRKLKENVCETSRNLHEYLTLHYASPKDVIGPWVNSIREEFISFPKRCADLCIHHGNTFNVNALNIGCAVGRSSFELAKAYDHVLGIDHSNLFIDTCNILKEKGSLSYLSLIEGELYDNLEATVDPSIDRTKVGFQHGDACALPLNLGQFDCVLASNVICKLKMPLNFLNRLPQLISSTGILVISTSYSFSKEYTPRENWIGGFKTLDGSFTGFDGIKKCLEKHFHLVDEINQPMLIKQTKREFQLTFNHIQIWKKI
ncbi:hypothetical protein HELRODRAFT_63046 [Helobdella robusta]|uniref:Methyltransferase type 11 domain-containing protein n=1 Tax=Helobdella robusta TaxID=6412 RepID=T1FXA3_HELRO|nr:hypothetical protein HELRODRAFT_63046 [Helobdella robusta]ESO12340.1 hypothetical protein HELRODRAFT_63046 [Helobdella robusta]